jgi:5-methylcytosine-specific restriction endonuclease McrA
MLDLEGELEALAADLGIEGLHDAAEATLQFALDGLDDPVREAAKVRCRQPRGGKRGKRQPGAPHKGVKIRADKRLAIYLRDGLRCMYCDEDLLAKWLENPESVHLDHVLPRSKRGKDSPVNLVTTCQHCNLSRQDKPLAHFTDEATIKRIQRNLKRNVCLLLPLIKAWIVEQALQRQMIKAEELQKVREKAQKRYPGDEKSGTAKLIIVGNYIYRRVPGRQVSNMRNLSSLESRQTSSEVRLRRTPRRRRPFRN